MAGMPGVGEAVALFTELLVREDLLQLFGFPTLLEKEWHRLLMTVQGVGAKAAMAILGTLGAEGAARAISLGDARSIQAAPGIGPKIAQRVVLELKSKAPAVMAMGAKLVSAPGLDEVIEPVSARPAVVSAPSVAEARATNSADALSALMNLGYGAGDAAQAVATVVAGDTSLSTGDLIRQALKLLAPKG